MGDPLVERFGRHYPAGTILFREGDAGAEMYVVHTGRVEITRRVRDHDTLVASIPPGEFFGEMAIVNNRPRSATATAVEESWLLVIDSRTFAAMVRARAEIALRMIRTLAARLEQANQQIDLLLTRDSGHRVVRCLRQLAERVGTNIESQTESEASEVGSGLFIPVTLEELATRVALPLEQVTEVLGRLRQARLVLLNQEAGIEETGFVVPEAGRLGEFLEFLEMKERFASR